MKFSSLNRSQTSRWGKPEPLLWGTEAQSRAGEWRDLEGKTGCFMKK